MRRRTFVSCLAVVFVSFLLLLSLCIYSFFRFLPYYQDTLEGVLSNVTGAKVTLKVSYAGWEGVDPVLNVTHVSLEGQNFHASLDKMHVKLNILSSLLHGKIITKEVNLSKPEVSLRLNDEANNYAWIKDISANALNSFGGKFNAAFIYMLAQKQLDIENMLIRVRSGGNQKEIDYHVNANFHTNQLGKSGVVTMSLYTTNQREKAVISATITQSQSKVAFNAVVRDYHDIFLKSLNTLSDRPIAKHLVNGIMKVAVKSSEDKLLEARLAGQLAGVEVQSPLTKKIHLRDILFHLRIENNNDNFQLIASPLTFITDNKRFTFTSALFTVSNERLYVNIPSIHLAPFSSLINTDDIAWREHLLLSGEFKNVNFLINLDKPDLDHIILRGQFFNLGVENSANKFDFTHLNGSLVWEGQSISLKIDSTDFKLGNNAVFTKAWPAISLNTNVKVSWDENSIKINAPDIKIQNQHFDYQGLLTLDIPKKSPLDTTIKVEGALNGSGLTDEYQSFLPRSGVPPDLYHWLMHNIYGADTLKAQVKIDGKITDIPFYQHPGMFYIRADVKGARLSPYDGWGTADQVNGRLLIDNQTLSVKVSSGNLLGLKVNNVDLKVNNIAPHLPSALVIQGQGNGLAKEAIQYLKSTKEKALINHFMRYFNYKGKLGFSLNFNFPLGDITKKDIISGEVHTSAGVLSSKLPFSRDIYGVNGKVSFVNDQIKVDNLDGFLASNAPVRLAGSLTVGDDDLINSNLRLSGALPVGIFNGAYSNMSWMLGHLEYAVPFIATIDGGVKSGSIHAKVGSLGNASYAYGLQKQNKLLIFPNTFYSRWQEKEDKEDKINSMMLDVYSKLAVKNNIQLNSSFRVEGNRLKNIHLNGQINTLNLDKLFSKLAKENAWQYKLFSKAPEYASETVSATHCVPYQNIYSCLYRQWINESSPDAALSVNTLILNQYSYQSVQLVSKSDHKATEMDINAVISQNKDNMTASIRIPKADDGVMELTANNIFIAEGDNKSLQKNTDSLESYFSPTVLKLLPDMDVKMTNLQIGAFSIPNLLMAVQIEHGSIFIPAFSIYDPSFKLLASAKLSSAKSSLSVHMLSSNWGEMLNNFGRDGILKNGSGSFTANLTWNGYLPNINDLNGQISANLTNGTLLSVSSGFAKYIGLLSIDSYFKRLFLSDSSIVGKGMAFNSLSGSYKIENGVAQSAPSVVIDTPSFSLVVEGEIDISTHKLDQVIKYQPHMSGTTAVVAGFLVNPVIGMATYLGGKILGGTLFKSTGLVAFKVTGTWDKPKIGELS